MAFNQDLIKVLKAGQVAIMPTDTIYGLVGQALNEETVARIKQLKDRPQDKPFIILISQVSDLDLFGVELNNLQQLAVKKYWSGPVSLILPTKAGPLAFRLPANEDLRALLKQTGPLVAPSANPRDLPPAKNIMEARDYFGNQVDYYADGGELISHPSKLIDLTGKEEKILRA